MTTYSFRYGTQLTPNSPSTRWTCTRDRNLGGPESYLNNRKARRRSREIGPLTEAQQELAIRFLPLARALAKPLKILFREWRDEFESAACLALVEAARAFDPAKNTKFATFARFRIRGALVDVGRVMEVHGWEDDPENAPSIASLTPFSEEHGSVLVATRPPEVGSEFEDIDSVEHLLRRLPKKHATLCRLRYVFGKTQVEIAEAFGCSQSEITRLHTQALDLLAEPYDSSGNKRSRPVWRHRKPGRKAAADRAAVQPEAVAA